MVIKIVPAVLCHIVYCKKLRNFSKWKVTLVFSGMPSGKGATSTHQCQHDAFICRYTRPSVVQMIYSYLLLNQPIIWSNCESFLIGTSGSNSRKNLNRMLHFSCKKNEFETFFKIVTDFLSSMCWNHKYASLVKAFLFKLKINPPICSMPLHIMFLKISSIQWFVKPDLFAWKYFQCITHNFGTLMQLLYTFATQESVYISLLCAMCSTVSQLTLLWEDLMI